MGEAFSSLKAFLLPFSPCGGNFATFFSVCFFFHNITACFAPFFHVEVFLLRLSPYGGLFSPFKSLSATFFSMLGLFCYVFSFYVGLFHYLKALLLRFSLLRGLFHRLKACGRGFFPPFESLSATFFFHVGVLFLFLWGPFLACPPPTKISAGAQACVSINPYERVACNIAILLRPAVIFAIY